MHLGTPEAYLKTLVRQLNSVNVATGYLPEEEREEFVPELHQALRACQMISLIYGHTVIAVAGSQGAGKTTLIRELYGLDGTWLAGNEGQGERVPVMVLEDEAVTAPQGFLYRWTDEVGTAGMRGTPVSSAAFGNATRAWGGNTLELPVLRVPVRHAGGRSKAGFMLLPGYEEINDRNEAWQAFMRLALVAASACVLVTDGSLLAQHHDTILVDLKEQQLAGVEPVIAIAKTEKMAEERRAELRATAAARFGVPEERAICTGSGNAADWEAPLLAALERHGGVGAETRVRQLQDLEKLGRMVGIVVNEARRAVRTSADLSDGGETLRDVLKELEDAIVMTRSRYENELSKALGSVAKFAGEAARADYIAAEAGWSNAGRQVAEWASLASHKSEQRAADRLRTAVQDAGGGAGFARTHAELLAGLASDSLALALVRPAPANEALIEHAGTPSAESLATLRMLVTARPPATTDLDLMQAQSLRREIRQLPGIAAGYLSAMQTVVAASPTPEKLSGLPELLQEGTDTIQSMNGLTKGLLKAVAAVLVVDAADGEIDSIAGLVNGIASTIGSAGAAFSGAAAGTVAAEAATAGTVAGTVGTGAASSGAAAGTAAAGATTGGTVAAAVATGATIALAAGAVAYAGVEVLSRHQTRGAEQARTAAIVAIRDQKTRHLAAFDEMMEWLKERVSERLRLMLRLDETLGHRLRAEIAINDLKNTRTWFQEEVRAQIA